MSTRPKYVVQSSFDYTHRVQVGIIAPHRRVALKKTEQLFGAGVIWDDTSVMPLLFDDLEEQDGQSPLFTIEAEYPDDATWPKPDHSVLVERKRAAAFQTAFTLLRAVSEDDNGNLIINTALLREALDAARATSTSSESP